MILEKQKEANILQSGLKNESIGMSLDLDSAQVLMQMLSKNLYSDSIGSAIRECASNALDSHRRAQVQSPIVVKFGRNDQYNYEFSVEDFGIGLDDNDVKNIISKYGKSTKRDSNTELGMMGLGFKAPLAYASSFYFTCRKDGVERKYMMYEGEDTNSIDLIYENPTTEKNGVKVIIPVSRSDRWDFENKIKEQLAYFQNVYFDTDNIVDNDFVIYRSETFQFSELSSDSNLHVCLDDVYYPLDFQKLGIDAIQLPLGLRFTLSDGLFPTPNREALRYTSEAKATILNKISEVGDYMVNKYNETIDTTNTDVIAAIRHYTKQDRYVNLGGKGNLNISVLVSYAKVKIAEPVIPKLKHIDLHSWVKTSKHGYLLREYEVKYRLESSRLSEVRNSWRDSISWDTDFKNFYIFKDAMRGNKKSYIKFLREDANITKFIKKTTKLRLGDRFDTGNNTYYEILNLKNFSKNIWREVIKEFQWMVSELIKDIPLVDDIEVCQQWLDDKKAATLLKTQKTRDSRSPKLEGDVSCKVASELLRYNDGRNCKFVAGKLNVSNVNDTSLIIFTHHDDFLKLDPLYKVAQRNDIVLITVSGRELDGMKAIEKDNILHYDEFMKGENIKFKQIVTAFKIKKLKGEYSDIFSRDGISYINKLHSTLGTDIEQLDTYQHLHMPRTISNEDILKVMSDFALENKLFDSTIWHTYVKVNKTIINHGYIDTLIGRMYWRAINEFLEIISNMMDYHKLEGRIEYKLKENN